MEIRPKQRGRELIGEWLIDRDRIPPTFPVNVVFSEDDYEIAKTIVAMRDEVGPTDIVSLAERMSKDYDISETRAVERLCDRLPESFDEAKLNTFPAHWH